MFGSRYYGSKSKTKGKKTGNPHQQGNEQTERNLKKPRYKKKPADRRSEREHITLEDKNDKEAQWPITL